MMSEEEITSINKTLQAINSRLDKIEFNQQQSSAYFTSNSKGDPRALDQWWRGSQNLFSMTAAHLKPEEGE